MAGITFRVWLPEAKNSKTETTGKTGNFVTLKRAPIDTLTGDVVADRVSMEIPAKADLNAAEIAMKRTLEAQGINIGQVREYISPTTGKRYAQASVVYVLPCEF